jgi:ABC-type lipoprotein export system ATPase subunit/ABC-type antimicrobial peptide transport system permease subunit
MMAFLSLRTIYKSYFLGKEEFPVLKGLDLNFELGEFVSILGESGGGKSTLMNIIGGLDREFEGQVIVDGTPLNHSDEKALNTYRRETVGYIYQSYNLISHLSVLDNVMVALDMTTLSKKEREARGMALLQQVGLAEHAKKHPSQLSGGQKQRVAIARALASDPKVIIADEPTGALDSENTEEVLQILNDIAAEGRLVIAVTHSQAVANTGTRILHMVDGKIDNDTLLRETYVPTEQTAKIHSRLLPAFVSYKNAAKHLKFNFWRNSLIVIGTAIGLFAVILFSGLGNGISGYISDQINEMTNPQVVTVTPYTKKSAAGPGGASSQASGSDGNMGAAGASTAAAKTLTDTQVAALKEVKHVKSVEKSLTASQVKVKGADKTVTISSLANWTASAKESILVAGSKPQKGEIVLDKKTVAKELSSNNWHDLIGQTVTVSYSTLNQAGQAATVTMDVKVAGIADSGSGMSISSNNLVNTATFTSAMKAANVSTAATSLAVKIDDLDHVKSANSAINNLKTAGKRVYTSTSVASIIDTVQTYVNLASTVLAVIAGISLVVSALMIIVTMYMSVSDRTKEIGILRALGESKRDIRRLFISESLIMGLISAVLATILAFGLGEVANIVISGIADYDFVQISIGNVVTTFAMAIVISLLAALLPSRHAASLNPIDALSAD